MIEFETDKKQLLGLLVQIHDRELAIPDFQRSFVWDASQTRELVVSIVNGYPAGSILRLAGGSHLFRPRAVDGAPELNGGNPAHLILDGQQRLTSLYRAFRNVGRHRYFLNLARLADRADLDEAVEVYPERRAKRWEHVSQQAADLMLPLSHLPNATSWAKDVAAFRHPDDASKQLAAFSDIAELCRPVIDTLNRYDFPVVTLTAKTPVEAVCTIFETLNSTGVRLSVFELLTARGWSENVNLRDLWAAAQAAHPILVDFSIEPYYLLQVLALRLGKNAKRSSVLSLIPAQIAKGWDAAAAGVAGALGLLKEECGVLSPRWLGYAPMLVTMGAVWDDVVTGAPAGVADRRAKLARWYWCSAFSGRYDNAANTRAEQDVPQLRTWFAGAAEPEVVQGFTFEPERWRTTTVAQRAFYQTTIALLLKNRCRDFHDGSVLTAETMAAHGVDDHHVFPRGYLAEIDRGEAVDSVLNHTLIDRKTNIRIGKRAPSAYTAEMATEQGEGLLSEILASHLLPSAPEGPLRTDRFDDFLDGRLAALTGAMETVTGWSAP